MKIKDVIVREDATITKSGPEGVEITAADGVKTILPADKASALAPDPQNPGEYDLNPAAINPSDAQPNAETGPKIGSKVDMKATEEATAPAAAPQVDPANYKVPSTDFLKKNFKHPADVIDGAHPSTTDPTRIGAWASDSDFADLMMALDGSYYQARQKDPNFQQPGFVKDDWELVQRMLGTPEGKEYAIANWIGLSDVNDKSAEAEFNRAQHKEFEKQANAKMAQQPNGVYTPGWKYDQKLGMTPAQAAMQQQQKAVKEDLEKMLRIAGLR